MSFRMFARVTSVCLSLLVSTSVFATSNTALDREIDRLINVVNNNVPAQHRPALNAAIERIIDASAKSCEVAKPPQPTQPVDPLCSIQRSSGVFVVKKDDMVLSQYGQFSILEAAKEHASFVNAGLCAANDLLKPCQIEKSRGVYVVTRENTTISNYGQHSILDAAKELGTFAEAGLCKADELAQPCSIVKQRGIFVVLRNDVVVSAYGHHSALDAAKEQQAMVVAGICK